jgi:DNA-3-methyladenine glycosylase
MNKEKISRNFYLRPTLEICEDLLGKFLVRKVGNHKLVGEINEVEAYFGEEDPASHAYRGMTARTEVMFGEGGHVYVYFTYGMYFCMNVVTEEAGRARAVLLRSVIPVEGMEVMVMNRKKNLTEILSKKNPEKEISNLTNGPGKLCQALGITREQNGLDLVNSSEMWIEDRGKKVPSFQVSPRIGISTAKEKLWRFYY